MRARAVTFVAPGQVELRELELAAPGAGEALVRVESSGLSAGTERLVLSGELDGDEPLDTNLKGMEARPSFPMRYGYCAVGIVEAVGADVEPAWLGRRVLALQPHQSHLVVPVASLIGIPTGVSADVATLLPNLETAVSLVMDGAPILGESVGVVGLGVVGQLVTALLTQLKLGPVFAIDPRADRRAVAERSGANTHEAPTRDACDLVIEVSGVMAGLSSALELARADGRVIVGSWFGREAQPLALGTRIHRARQTVRFSQVSRIDSALSHRFTHARRMAVAIEWLSRLPLASLVTHHVAAERAPDAYALLMAPPTGCLHIVLSWSP